MYFCLTKKLKEIGMNNAALAEYLGISEMGVYRRLRGLTTFKLTEVIKICVLFPEESLFDLFAVSK